MCIAENANAPSSDNAFTVKNLPFTTIGNNYKAIGSATADNYFNMTVMVDNYGDNIINFAHGATAAYYHWDEVANNARITFFAVYHTTDA